MSEQESTFSIRNLTVILLISGLSLALTLYFLANKDKSKNEGQNFSSITYDRSALGMRALFDLLLRVEAPVVTSSSINSRVYGNLVVVADVTGPHIIERAKRRYSRAKAILFVLPKRRIGRSIYYNRFAVNSIISKLLPNAQILRRKGVNHWAENNIDALPTISDTQLITGTGFKSLIKNSYGTLLAEIYKERQPWQPAMYILADPDPFLNHGLDDNNNAVFAYKLLNTLKPARGKIVIDDNRAGGISSPSIWGEMFKFPMLALTLTILAVFVLICLQSLTRFGSIEPNRTLLKPGRDTILEASSTLVLRDGHYVSILRAYWQQTLRMVGKRYNAPSLSDSGVILEHLKNIEKNINPSVKYMDIFNSLQTSGALKKRHQITKIAGMIHQWQKEMLSEQN